MNDLKLLNDLLESEKLNDEQEAAFSEMLKGLVSKKFAKLTSKQREWAEDLHAKIGLDPGVENLVSSGKMKVSDTELKEVQDFVATKLGPKFLKPPNRR